jgi:hypothetical protein
MMRLSQSTAILLLATTLVWLGVSAVPAVAQVPGGCQYPGNYANPAQGQCMGPNPYAAQYPGQGPNMGQEQPAESPYLINGVCEPDDCGPRWIITGGAVALQRSVTRSQTLFTDESGAELLNAKDLSFPMAFGAKISGVRRGPCGWELEVAYSQIDSFMTNAFVAGPALFVYQTGDPFQPAVQDINVSYKSALYSGEVLLRRQWLDWLNLSAGFRMIELDEHYMAGTFDPASFALAVNTYNHLFGFQLGADAEVYNMGGPLQINVICKGGVYANSASQNIALEQSLAAERSHTAFFGEAAVVTTYALTSHLAFRGSVGAAWLAGVALAPEQIGATSFDNQTTECDTNGSIFYYGGSLGLEFRY